MNDMSPADIAAMTNNADGSSAWWIIVLFALIFGWGNGGYGNNNFANAIGYENLATSNEVQRGFDNQNLQAQTRDIQSAVTSGTAQAVAATNQTFHDTAALLYDKYNELSNGISQLAVGQANALANQNQCCCNTQMLIQQTAADTNAGIAQNRYDAAMNTAAINANTTAQTQKILDAIQQNKIDSLQSQVNQLQMAQAMNGVVRYPDSFAYNAGTNPFCTCNCGGTSF